MNTPLTLAKRVRQLAESLTVLAAELSDMHDAPTSRVIPMSQRDPLWAGKPLGTGGGYTLGSAGCALLCATMVVSQIEPTITPDVLQDGLLKVRGFNGPYIAWNMLPALFSQIRTGAMVNYSGPANMAEIRTALDLGPCPMWVDFNPSTARQETHFVLGIEIVENDIYIIDPWLGAAGFLRYMYGGKGAHGVPNWTIERAVYGIRPMWIDRGVSFSALLSEEMQPDYDTAYPK